MAVQGKCYAIRLPCPYNNKQWYLLSHSSILCGQEYREWQLDESRKTMYIRTPNSTYSITKFIEPPCQETQLTLGKRWVIAMTCFNPILQGRFPKSPEFHTAKLQRLSTGQCIDVTRQSKNNALLPWLTSGSRRKTSYKLQHSNWNMLFQLMKLHNLFLGSSFHNLVASLSYKDIYQYGALIHVIIRPSTQALQQSRTK